MSVFLCVLFKTDGRFTLAEMGDKQLRKNGGNRWDKKRERHRHPFQFHRQALTPVVDIHDFLALLCFGQGFFNYSGVKVGYVVCFNKPGSQGETKFILSGS